MTTNLTPTTTVLVDSGVIAKGQGYGITRIYSALPNGQVVKVRISVDRNSHDFQSRHVAEVWTPVGWQPVTSVAGTDPEATAMPSYVLFPDKNTDAGKGRVQCIEAAEAMCSRLLADALLVLS